MQAFVRVVELGTFSAAADELRVKQPTVSKWIAELERQLAVPLLERTTRSHRLTDAGQLFYRRAQDMLATYAATAAELEERAREPRGRIRVSLPVVFGQRYVVPAMARFLERYPAIEVELLFSDRYVNLVEAAIDVAIRVGIPVDSSFRARSLGVSRRFLVAAPDYCDRAPALTTPGDLRAHPCLTHTALGAGDVWTFQRQEQTVRAPVGGRFAANNSEALLAMARAGLGIALLASWLVADDLRSGRLVALLPGWRPPPAPTQALTPPSRFQPPRVRLLLDHLDDALRAPLQAADDSGHSAGDSR